MGLNLNHMAAIRKLTLWDHIKVRLMGRPLFDAEGKVLAYWYRGDLYIIYKGDKKAPKPDRQSGQGSDAY